MNTVEDQLWKRFGVSKEFFLKEVERLCFDYVNPDGTRYSRRHHVDIQGDYIDLGGRLHAFIDKNIRLPLDLEIVGHDPHAKGMPEVRPVEWTPMPADYECPKCGIPAVIQYKDGSMECTKCFWTTSH